MGNERMIDGKDIDGTPPGRHVELKDQLFTIYAITTFFTSGGLTPRNHGFTIVCDSDGACPILHEKREVINVLHRLSEIRRIDDENEKIDFLNRFKKPTKLIDAHATIGLEIHFTPFACKAVRKMKAGKNVMG
jgi:hypothetical protein